MIIPTRAATIPEIGSQIIMSSSKPITLEVPTPPITADVYAPIPTKTPQASFISALRALPAVVIGGLDSIPGAVVGSLIIGLTQGYVAYYQINLENIIGFSLGSGFSLIAPYLIMFVILLVKPDGLFGREEVERV